MKQVTRLFAGFLLLFFSTTLLAQMHYNYNTAGASNNFPFNILPATGKTTQTLYLPGDFNNPSPPSAGNITKIYFRAGSTGNPTFTNLKIKMGQTTDTDLPATAWYTGTMTTVFDQANYSITGTTGNFFSITLTTPFPFNPALSLVVEVEQCGYTGTGVGVFTTNTSGIKRHTSNQSTPPPTACPHAWFNTGTFMTHTGIDIAPAGPVNCSYGWSAQTSGITSTLYSVKAVNNLVAWAVGTGGIVRRTTDGGVTWGNGNPNPGVINGDIYNVEALDANTAWVTTSPGATFIYKTTNGGTNWTQVYTLAAAFLNAIKMVSPTNGYGFGDPVGGNWLIIGTTDGGNTWAPISAPPGTGDGRNNCVQVSLPNMWFGTGQGTVWKSTNSGINWTSTSTAPLTTQVLGIKFNDANTGLLGGASLIRTTNGGANWTAVTAPGTGNISGIDGSGNDYWFVRGTGVFRSTDAGLNWTQVHTPVGTQNDVKLANDPNNCLVGWTIGSTGGIAKMSGTPVGVNGVGTEIPNKYVLEQNYPNPFNPTTSIKFSIPNADYVKLKVFDALGREVEELVNEQISAGIYQVSFDASNLATGIYFYTIETPNFVQTKKMMLIK